jgi:hypothetical protein
VKDDFPTWVAVHDTATVSRGIPFVSLQPRYLSVMPLGDN